MSNHGRGLPDARTPLLSVLCIGLVGWAALTSGCSKPADQDAETSANASTGRASGTLAAVSKYDAGPRAIEGKIAEDLAEQGKALFQTKGCSACHGFGAKSAGPDLVGVTRRRTAAWMEQQILHPEIMVKEDPIAHEMFAKFMLQMPNQGVTPAEAKAIVEYLKHKDHEAGESH
jgi:mono/diheme cytochrome c family protein